MYLLSNLIEEYLWAEKFFIKRRLTLYLEGWIEDMIKSGCLSQSIYDFQDEFSFEHNKILFERVIRELNLLEKCNVSEINEEFLFRIVIYEYQHGCYDSASEFLYYKKYVAEKTHFPYNIEYSGRFDEYFTKEKTEQGTPLLSGKELEDYVFDFLSERITQNINNMKCFGYYIVKPLPKPEWCSLNSSHILSVSDEGLSDKFPDLKKCFWINYPESHREQYQKELQLSDEEFSEFCRLTADLFYNKLLTSDSRFSRFEDVLRIAKYLKNVDGYRIIGIFADENALGKFEKEGTFEVVMAGKDITAQRKSLGFDILGGYSMGMGDFSFFSYISSSLNEDIDSESDIGLKIDSHTGLIQNSFEETKVFCNLIQGRGEPVEWTPFEMFEFCL